MQSVIFEAKDFQNRQELEEYIRAKVGIGSNDNKSAGHSIQGTKEEMTKLHLSETSSVYGVQCVVSDDSIIKKVDDRKAKNN